MMGFKSPNTSMVKSMKNRKEERRRKKKFFQERTTALFVNSSLFGVFRFRFEK